MRENARILSEEELTKLISQLPTVVDERSKEQIYEEVSSRLRKRQKRKRKFRSWLVPLVTAAAIFLVLIISNPSLFLKQQGGAEQDTAELMTVSSENESFNDAVVREMDNAHFQTMTVPYVDEHAELIIPISFQVNETDYLIGRMEEFLNDDIERVKSINGSSILKGSILEEVDGELVLTVPESTAFVGGSARVTLFLEALQVILDSLKYEKIKLKTAEQPFVMLEQYGEVSELKKERRTGGYFLYRTSSGVELLVPGELAYFNRVHAKENTFSAVLQAMESPQNVGSVSSPFPDGVSIEEMIERQNSVDIRLEGVENLKNDARSQLFVEAILLTAKQFDIDEVTFLNSEQLQVGPYDLGNALQTNIFVNVLELGLNEAVR